MKSVSAVAMSVLGLAACGKKDPGPPPATTAAPQTTSAATTAAADAAAPTPEDAAAPAPEDAAAPAPEDAAAAAPSAACAAFGKLAVDFAALDAEALTVCGQADGAGWCYAVALASGAVTGQALPEDDVSHIANTPGAIEDPFRRKDGEPVLQLCLDATTGCKDVYVGQALAAWLAADKKTFAVTTLEDKEKHVRLFDAATYAEVGNHVVEKDVDLPDCSFAAPIGAAVVVATGPCSGATGRKAWLMDAATGAKIADLGGAADAEFDLRLGGFVPVGGDRWAFRDARGTKIVVQDIKTGEVAATADLSTLAAKDVPAWLFTAGDPVRLVAVENRPTPGATWFIDPATGKVERQLTPDACAKAP